jgi:hypothetical protein
VDPAVRTDRAADPVDRVVGTDASDGADAAHDDRYEHKSIISDRPVGPSVAG